MNSGELITVVVVTYNSAKYVLETLDSVKDQSYSCIELIVSDDGSTDDTVEICTNWINTYSRRFNGSYVLTVPKNTGTPSNCNRGLQKAKGSYIKFIAGDDLLLPNCIDDDYKYMMRNPEAQVMYSSFASFSGPASNRTIVENRPKSFFKERFNTKDSKKQLRTYIKWGVNITPSSFYKKVLLTNLGGFDTRYRIFEDTPMFIKILRSGYPIHYLDTDTVLYRVDSPSVTRNERQDFFYKQSFCECEHIYRKENIYELFTIKDLWFWIPELSERFLYRVCVDVFKNKKTPVSTSIYYMIKFINPYFWYKRLYMKYL